MFEKSREETGILDLDFSKRDGLVPVIVQDSESLEVLMQAWSNQEAFERTLSTGLATFWSTSRKEIWVKGQTSGDSLVIQEIRVDCDQDCLLYLVERKGGGVCHTFMPQTPHHRISCFYRTLDPTSGRLVFHESPSLETPRS